MENLNAIMKTMQRIENTLNEWRKEKDFKDFNTSEMKVYDMLCKEWDELKIKRDELKTS